jgi:DNA-binding transcriptional LysR family regulator
MPPHRAGTTARHARGTLRIGLPLVGDLTLPLMAEFMAAYPDIRLDLDFSDRLVDVIEEGFDAVLRVGEPSDSRMNARRLGVFHAASSPHPPTCSAAARRARRRN